MQGSPSSQSASAWHAATTPTQIPAWHVSWTVAESPSSQGVPSDVGWATQPTPSTHTPT